jgi:hypothetical protein
MKGIAIVGGALLALWSAGLDAASSQGAAPSQEAAPTQDVAAAARQEAALESVPIPLRDGAVVVAWSQKAYDVAFAEDQFLTFKGHRAFAMTHLAVHDALNAIVPVYRQYARLDRDPLAHPIAAAAQAAHDVLLSQYAGARADLDAELERWLDRVPGGLRKTRGIALGRRAAAAILELREGDGYDLPGTYTFDPAPGAYQTTPPWNGFVAQPGFRFAKPFGIEAPDQFRPAPPPSLETAAYAAAFQEVKDFGRVDSTVRTPDQTAYALWWMEFAEGSVNRLARKLVAERHTHLWRTARLFALLNVCLFDTYVAVWDSKYEHNHWRPYTAIREADRDGNPATSPDAAWESLRPAPPFPDYLSAHAAACASTFATLKRVFPTVHSFTMDSTTAPAGMPTRTFPSFAAAARECADSRVRIGFHFRYATDGGLALGRALAQHVAEHHLEPR